MNEEVNGMTRELVWKRKGNETTLVYWFGMGDRLPTACKRCSSSDRLADEETAHSIFGF